MKFQIIHTESIEAIEHLICANTNRFQPTHIWITAHICAFLISISIDCVTFELYIQFFSIQMRFRKFRKKWHSVHPIKWGQYLNYLSNLQPINIPILHSVWLSRFQAAKMAKKWCIIFMTSNKWPVISESFISKPNVEVNTRKKNCEKKTNIQMHTQGNGIGKKIINRIVFTLGANKPALFSS